MIDSSDKDRFKEIYKEFKNIFKEELKPHCAFLIFANKQVNKSKIIFIYNDNP